MASKGTKVTKKERFKMWQLYQELESYTLVAKKLRRDPATVARHVALYETALNVANILR